MRLFCGLLFLFLLGTFAPVVVTPPDPPPAMTFITFEPLDAAPRSNAGGRLQALGAWRLESNDRRFGGLSAMHVADGQVLALSDAGWMVRFPLAAAGTRQATIAPLPGPLGVTARKRDRDVESLAAHAGRLWLGMERQNAVWRFEGAGLRQAAAARPAVMREWGENRGAEAMVRLGDGRFLVIAEGRGGESDAILFLGDPADARTASVRMRYRAPRGYRVTDAAVLPDGRILFLHRRTRLFEGITAKLAIAALPERSNGAVMVPEEIATLAPPAPVDNMEALSITREGGRTILWIASDDNYMPLQRTLLLKFALAR